MIMVAVTQRTLPIPGPTDLVSLTGPGETPRVCSASDLALSLLSVHWRWHPRVNISSVHDFDWNQGNTSQFDRDIDKIVQHLRNYSMRDWIWIFPPTGASHLLGRGARAWQWPPVSRVLGTACSGACRLQSAPHCRLCRTQSASLAARTILCIPSSVTQPKFQRNLLYRSLMRWAWREERCQREASGLGVSTLIL